MKLAETIIAKIRSRIRTKRDLFIAVGIAVFLILTIFYIILYRPKVKRLSVLIPNVKKAKMELDNTKSSISRMKSNLQTYENKQILLEELKKSFPSEDEIPSFLEYLSKIARRSGIKIEAIRPLDNGAESLSIEGLGKNYIELPIVVNAKAGYHQLGSFINDLEISERFVQIEELRVTQDYTDPLRHNVSITIKTYVLKSDYGL